VTGHDSAAPASWLLGHRDLLPLSGTALDVACGRGRNARWLAAQGFDVLAVDRDETLVRALAADATRLGLSIRAEAVDLEHGAPSLGVARFDVIVVVHYLHRPLVPHLIAALRDGGVLVYETFTRDQARRGRPTNPDFLLEPGELARLVAPLRILASREGDFDDRFVASVVAQRAPVRGYGGSSGAMSRPRGT
jgi:SAM-dependent methyltransferase